MHQATVHCQVSESEATQGATQQEISSEDSSCVGSWVQIDEIVLEDVIGDSWGTTLLSLGTSTHDHSQGPGEQETNAKVNGKVHLIRVLLLSLILPGPSLWASHIFSESVSDPRIRSELVF